MLCPLFVKDAADELIPRSAEKAGFRAKPTGHDSKQHLRPYARELHIRALEPSVVCRVPQSYVEALVRIKPEVGLRLARTLATQLQLMEDRWADMVEKEVSERLAAVLYMLVESVGVMSKEGPMIPTRYTHQQHPPATRLHDRLQQGSRNQSVRRSARGGVHRAEEPPRLRKRLRRPQESRWRVGKLPRIHLLGRLV